MKYRAFIFDMNGTMVDDMHYHEVAWHDVMVNKLKAPLTQEQLKLELYGKAEEMFERVFGKGRFPSHEIKTITNEKESRYRQEFLPHLKLINGLNEFIDKARSKNIALAIGTAAPVLNVDFVLDNLDLRKFFPVIIGPEDVAESKPHPAVFLKAASQLGVAPEECIVFEDAPKGIEAARRAGMKSVGITSFHTTGELENDSLLFTVADYNDSNLDRLFTS